MSAQAWVREGPFFVRSLPWVQDLRPSLRREPNSGMERQAEQEIGRAMMTR